MVGNIICLWEFSNKRGLLGVKKYLGLDFMIQKLFKHFLTLLKNLFTKNHFTSFKINVSVCDLLLRFTINYLELTVFIIIKEIKEILKW